MLAPRTSWLVYVEHETKLGVEAKTKISDSSSEYSAQTAVDHGFELSSQAVQSAH